MSIQPSEALTQSLLRERKGGLPRTFAGLIGRLMEPIRDPLISPYIWVLWGEPYADIFNGIGLGIQLLKERDMIGSDRPVHVYEAQQHSLFDFLELPDDNGIAFVHEAHRLEDCSEATNFVFFSLFQMAFERKYRTKQIVFLSSVPFLTELDAMEYQRIDNGRLVTSCDPAEMQRMFSDPTFLECQARITASSPNLMHHLRDPRGYAEFMAEGYQEVLKDVTDQFHGRVPNDRLIRTEARRERIRELRQARRARR